MIDRQEEGLREALLLFSRKRRVKKKNESFIVRSSKPRARARARYHNLVYYYKQINNIFIYLLSRARARDARALGREARFIFQKSVSLAILREKWRFYNVEKLSIKNRIVENL